LLVDSRCWAGPACRLVACRFRLFGRWELGKCGYSHFLLLPYILASLRSFCHSYHFCCHHSAIVSQPSQTPPCPTPSPLEGPDALASAPSWPFARPPPQGEGVPGFALNPKSLNITAALRLVPASLHSHQPLHAAVPRCVDEPGILLL
jgi:hypothetical protein